MEIINFILHIEQYLRQFITDYGIWVYMILFLIIFCETGLVVTPFLPGDSLLFALGMLATENLLNLTILYPLLLIAAISGDTLNYWIGKWIGEKAYNYDNKYFKREYLLRAHEFYEKHGGKAIFIARFVPIIRTFAPFVSGIANMNYPRFLFYNVFGAVVWITLFMFGGYFLGNLPGIKSNFKLIIILIIIVSILPIIYEWWKSKKQLKKYKKYAKS